jgi:chemotaxis signal transduction protein/CheY-like chemotaxis protein
LTTARPDLRLLLAQDGFRAGELVARERPETVLLDIYLPGVDGFEVCRRVKSSPETKDTLVIAMSANNTPDVRDTVLQAGAAAFLPKPVDFARLLALLAQRVPLDTQGTAAPPATISLAHGPSLGHFRNFPRFPKIPQRPRRTSENGHGDATPGAGADTGPAVRTPRHPKSAPRAHLSRRPESPTHEEGHMSVNEEVRPQSQDKAGKYLTFKLGPGHYGLEILKVREIIGLIGVTAIPLAPAHVKGVINLRGTVIPVVDLRQKFGMDEVESTAETCIIVAHVGDREIGVLVDRLRGPVLQHRRHPGSARLRAGHRHRIHPRHRQGRRPRHPAAGHQPCAQRQRDH